MQPGMGAGCEGGRCGFLLPASRISTKDTKGHEGKRRRRSQGDDRKSGPRTAAGADWEQGRSSLQPVCCAPSLVQFTVSEPDLEEIMAAFRRFDPIQMQLPWRELGGCSPEWGRGVKGGDAASFCQLQGYPRRTQRGTKESGDGDPREMTANLDRAPPPARTGNRADRVFNPFAARHHWFNLQCLNRIWKRSWQHFGALTQFRCNCPGENWVGCSPEWGRGVKGGMRESMIRI